MRILHLWDNYSPGLFDHSHELCLAHGHDSRVLCMHLFDRGQSADDRVSAIRRMDESADQGRWARLGQWYRRSLDRRRFRRAVQRRISVLRPDVVHFHFGTTAAALEGVAGLFSVPHVISFYGFDISAGLEDAALRQAYQRLLPGAETVHVLCEQARERAVALGARAERTVLTNLPLDVATWPLIESRAGSVSRWLIPARFVAKKGHLVLLDAFSRHLADHPDASLTCWGYGQDRWLIDEIAKRGLSARVSVTQSFDPRGFDLAYREQLAIHDAVLAPSIRAASGDDEGGPALTAVMAQLCGKPVIYSDFPGSECSLRDGVEGFVVPQGDSAALAQAMQRMAADPARAMAMGLAGRKRVLAEFTPESYWAALSSWYRQAAR